ncbi:MAG: inositol monophosphatase [Candidatus Aenigmarchaeota archaeon]|nr:inositol monophosphatase [Candidatus Aenigmarchaeota archaeon]
MYERELKVAKLAVERAKKILLNYHRKELEVSNKIGVDIVTNADLEAEKIIANTLKKNFPDYGILAEEGGTEGNQDKKWIIDPLDGTYNFSRGSEIFGITIALEINKSVVLGIIDLPVLKEQFIAIKNKGAFMNKKRISVSNVKGESSSVILGGGWFAKESKENESKGVKLAKDYNYGFRRYGSAIYSLALVASGRAEAMISTRHKTWDVSAGCLMIEEAGGICTDFNGNHWSKSSGKYISSNKVIHKEILAILRE